MMSQKASISPYLDYKKSEDIHGTALYPAVMVGPVQRELLKEYVKRDSNMSIIDPFVGSGTSLYEALQISNQATLVGSDINPLAILISRVKLEGVCKRSIDKNINHLIHYLKDMHTVPETKTFPGRDKWFQPSVALSIQSICDAIQTIDNQRNRRFFWYMLIDIIRKYCNSRSSTYKLHIRPESQIKRIQNHVARDYLKKVCSEVTYFKSPERNYISPLLYQGDTSKYLSECENDSFDLCITSPPYGDNATTVPYGQYSTLALSWISKKDIDLQGWELSSYAAIDSSSLGGAFHNTEFSSDFDISDIAMRKTIDMICERKRRKVKRFLHDYRYCINEIARVTKSTIILTLGNRTVDGKKIDLTGFTIRLLEAADWQIKKRMTRAIPNKRIPTHVSRVGTKPVSSMKEEYIIVAQAQK